METTHLFEDAYYLVGNKSVAKCFMFKDENDCQRFKTKIDYHLKPLCDVIGFGLLKDEFQLLVKLKSREVFEDYFVKRYEYRPESGNVIPETTYIFAQAMSNLQSGYAKYFNYKYERDGGLMCGRYFRELVESEEHLDELICSMHKLQEQTKRNRIWTFRRKEVGFRLDKLTKTVKRSSYMCYILRKRGSAADAELQCFRHRDEIFLRGCFDNLPPKRIFFVNRTENLKSLLNFMFLKSK